MIFDIYRFGEGNRDVGVNLVVTSEHKAVNRTKNAVIDLRNEVSNFQHNFSDLRLNFNQKSIENTQSRLEAIKKLLITFSSKTNTSGRNSLLRAMNQLDNTGFSKMLPGSVQSTLSASASAASITNDPKQYMATMSAINTLTEFYNELSVAMDKNTESATKNVESLNNALRTVTSYKSALSTTAENGGAGSSIVSLAAGGYDGAMVRTIQDTNKALSETGAIMSDVAGKSATLTSAMTENKNVFNGVSGILKKIPKNLSDVEKGFRSLSLVRLTYLWHGIKRVSSGFVQAIENTAKYEESLNLFKMSIGQKYIKDADDWSNELTDKLMIDRAELMQYTGTFNNLAEGLGVYQDDAYEMSKALTQLTYDMSSYLNIDPSAAATKLQSAMSGQARAIQGVGVAIQVASLQELAYELGIEKTVSTMTQAEKTYLRYIQLMKSTTHMQGDLGATMITPANAIRILKTQITLLSRAIGEVLTPLIMRVLPWIMALTNWLTKAASWLGKLLGYEVKKVDMGDAFYNASDAVEDYADSVDEAGKKVKNSLAPFDNLNVVMSSSSSAGDISDSSVLDILRQEVESYDMLERYNKDLKKKAEDLEGAILPLFAGIVTFVGSKKILDLITGFSKLGTAMGTAGTNAMSLKTYLGYLAKIGVIAISVSIIIACGKKVYDDFQALKADIQDAISPEVEKKANKEITANLGELESDIASGNVDKNAQKHVDATLNNINQILSNMKGIQNQFKGTNAIMNAIAGTSDDWRKRLDEVLDRYKIVNKQTKTLIDNTKLTSKQAKEIKTTLIEQRDALKEQLTHLTKGSDKYKATESAIRETKSLISDINDKYFPKTEQSLSLFKEDSESVSNSFNTIKKSTQDVNNNISKTNETLSVSKTETKSLADLLKPVKTLFGDIDASVGDINNNLSTSDTKTGAWKENLSSIKTTITEDIKKPFGSVLSLFDTKKTLTVDAKKAKSTVDELVNKSDKLNTTKTLKLNADTKNANSVLDKLFGKESLLGKVTKKLGFDVDFFADGGYPTSGELFFANENGRAEFITSIGNKTAVANQDQMVQALTNAIMAGFAMTAPRSESKQPINVNIGNERVYSGVIDYQNRQSDRYGTTTTIEI